MVTVITQAVRVNLIVGHMRAGGDYRADLDALDKLSRLGFSLAEEAPTPDSFLPMASTFSLMMKTRYSQQEKH